MSEAILQGPSEAQFQEAVVEYARVKGWKVAHFRRSMNKRGVHLTAVAYDATGFPDLLLVRERVVFAEIKAEKGRRSMHQLEWAEWLDGADAEYHLWRPSDWPRIEQTLA